MRLYLVSFQKTPFISYQQLPNKSISRYLIMAKTNPKVLFFLILSSLLCYGVLCRPDYEVKHRHKEMLLLDTMKQPEGLKKEASLMGEDGRRMIGSTAPPCTFNECKGCRFRCSAEQVPVDASDPMNSAYRYKCICHR